MYRVLVALVTLALLVVVPAPARAEHASGGTFYDSEEGGRWNETVTETYCFQSGFQTLLSDQQYSYMRQTTANRINVAYEDNTQIDTDWVQSSSVCANDYSFNWYQSDQPTSTCGFLYTHHYPLASRFSYTDLPGTDVGDTITCDFDDNGNIDFFWIAIDNGRTYHWNVQSGGPTSGNWDYAGLLMHEFGHATGFTNHFSDTSDACDTFTAFSYNTMCKNSDHGIKNTSISDGTWWRTLESHDSGAINEVY